MPTQREWRERDAARADQQLLDRAVTFLREDPARRQWAALSHNHVAEALADLLLEALGDGMAGLDSGVRWQAVQPARVLLGEPMESPTIRWL
jgi:hypothetical protein